ncbi:cyclin family protein [Halorussus amylolyticus]|uniref:hypothetical protein n=1 Tax=Halorussus amylolyticus TaxID=1126242 RepID=UPI001EE4118D|nr:hypothetical protein [Halorussus amylolyticus]
MEINDPKPMAKEICFELDLSVVVLVKAEKLIDCSAEQGLLSGRSPSGVAAGAVYAASLLTNRKRTQSEISNVSEVSDATIRKRYQELLEAYGIVGDWSPHLDKTRIGSVRW